MNDYTSTILVIGTSQLPYIWRHILHDELKKFFKVLIFEYWEGRRIRSYINAQSLSSCFES